MNREKPVKNVCIKIDTDRRQNYAGRTGDDTISEKI